MPPPQDHTLLHGSEHPHPADHKHLGPAAGTEHATVTLILRRRDDGPKLRGLDDFAVGSGPPPKPLSRAEFAAAHGADPKELDQVAAYARAHGLHIVETNQARRSVVVRGPIAALNQAFGITLCNYDSPHGRYRGHQGGVTLPQALTTIVESISGLDTRPVPARRHAAVAQAAAASRDPPNTVPLTPQIVAQLYAFPPGDGAGQTIGIFEMPLRGATTSGYAAPDLARTMQAFGDNLPVPTPIDVTVDGPGNAGVSDVETVLDITVASAIAPAAKIAVYFTSHTTQGVIHALQRMVHPGPGDPQPTILSISYNWGADDKDAGHFSEPEITQIDQLFQDAANLGLTVLVSSGDTGACLASTTQAQTNFPATEPWVIACGGTTIGAVDGADFVEYVWNDTWPDGAGATGGGVSARFPLPNYQNGVAVPPRNGTGTKGRGIPDIAGNASANSGYMLHLDGEARGPAAGTSAVAPLFAGLIARINGNLGHPVGFINPILYSLAASAFRGVASPPGPVDNSYNGVAGYPAKPGWNPCTGLGSVKGTALQDGLKAAHAVTRPPGQAGT
jgi:kumamolisin